MRSSTLIVSALSIFVLAGSVLAQGGAPAAPSPQPAGEAKPAENTDKLVYVKVSTSMGDIVIELNETKAPISVKNFLDYADKGHYNGTIFHRVIGDFMIQGGGHTPDGKEKQTGDPIRNESQNGLKNARGTIAMARKQDPNSATAQFYINVNDNSALDAGRSSTGNAGYAVFGRVVEGMGVVDKIKAVETNKRAKGASGGASLVNPDKMPDQPLQDVLINTIARTKAPEKK